MTAQILLIIYISICILAILLIPAVKNQWVGFIKVIPGRYKQIDWSAISDPEKPSIARTAKKVVLTLITVICICLFFILTPLLIPLLIKKEKENKKFN